ncbi:MAG TPA: redoxin domain-containing protein [Terriglobales bacterium]|jgi:thiol-disulfide isomerase/thioredoxin|nr:redoxin domain-containing protein [Terriglobales bacterium]
MKYFSALLLLFCLILPAVAQVDLKVYPAPDFGEGVVWLDAGAATPHHISDYRGKVVLVDFWEYTCINCIRDFAVVKRWYTKYHPYGFDVIGVHYGEFDIGFDVNNVKEAAQRFKLPWLVVADQKGTTWKAYQADGWPDRFLIDPQGQIVMKVFGEGNNLQMETKIRELVAKAHPEVMKVPLDPSEDEFRAECGNTTQETYVGEIHGRGSVENMNGHHAGETVEFMPPHSPPDGGVELVGKWKIENDGVTSEAPGAGAEVRYHARSMYAVMSVSGARQVRVNLVADGGPLSKDDAGADVKFDSKGAYVEVSQGRMYYLVRSPKFTAHLISLEPEGPGLTLHSFTYGNNCQLEDKP